MIKGEPILIEWYDAYSLDNWNHGVARIEKDNNGDFEVINIRLMKNKLFRT